MKCIQRCALADFCSIAGVILVPALRAATRGSLPLDPSATFLSGDLRSDLIPATSFFALLSLTAIFYSSIFSVVLPCSPVV